MGTVFPHLKDLMFDSGSAWWPSSRPRSVARFLPPSPDPDMLDPQANFLLMLAGRKEARRLRYPLSNCWLLSFYHSFSKRPGATLLL